MLSEDQNSIFPSSTLIADAALDADLESCLANPACKAVLDQKLEAAKAKRAAEKEAAAAAAETAAAAKPAKVSAAKAKIEAAKKATADKAAAGGFAVNEGKATSFGLSPELFGGEEKDPFAEADALREKIRALKSSAGGKQLSKSKSAQLAQLKQMESMARDKARTEAARQAEKAERAAARQNAKSEPGVGGGSGSYEDQFAKITGTSLPSLPSLPSVPVPSLPSLPF